MTTGKKIIAIVGLAILVLGAVLVGSPSKTWGFPKEVQDLLTGDRRQWAFTNVPYVQQGYKIRVVFAAEEEEIRCLEAVNCPFPSTEHKVETSGAKEEQQVFVGLIRSNTFFDMFPSTTVRQLPPDFSLDTVKAVSVAWTVGHEGNLTWQAANAGEYAVVFLSYKGEPPIPLSGRVYWETNSETYQFVGILLIIIGAVVAVYGVRGRLLPKPV